MKSTILLFTIIVSICVVSCNKTDKKAQLENLKQQQRALAEEIKKLEKEEEKLLVKISTTRKRANQIMEIKNKNDENFQK